MSGAFDMSGSVWVGELASRLTCQMGLPLSSKYTRDCEVVTPPLLLAHSLEVKKRKRSLPFVP